MDFLLTSPKLCFEFFSQLVNDSRIAFVIQDTDDRLVVVSKAFARQFGYSRRDLVGKTLTELIIPDYLVAEARDVSSRVMSGLTVEQETIRHGKDGSMFHVHLTALPLIRDSRIVARIAIYNDITSERTAQRKYREIVDNAVEGIFQSSVNGRYLQANPALAAIYGYDSPQELMAHLQDIAGQLYVKKGRREEFMEVMRRDGRVAHFESQIRQKDGSVIWIEEHARAVCDASGNPLYFEGAVIDITSRKKAEEDLKKSEEEYRTIFDTTGTASVIIEQDMSISLANSEFLALTGYTQGDLDAGLLFSEVVAPADKERIATYHKARRSAGTGAPRSYELRIISKQGEVRDTVITVALLPGDTRTVASLADISDRKRAEQMLKHQAFHDPLTGLPNRFLLMDRLEHVLSRRGHHNYAVLFLDLDRFKVINDSLGHLVGDMLLERVSETIKSCLRKEDTLARFGGDEFVILIEDVPRPSLAIRVAERILEKLETPFTIDEHVIHAGTSIGIVQGCLKYNRPEQLLRDADTAMYRAKANGKGCYALFDQNMHTTAVDLLQMENDLRTGLEQNQFILHYQPIHGLEKNILVGFEALVRWEHPVRGMVPPDKFIPLAEETGLIIPLGRQILRDACNQMQTWQNLYPFREDMVMHVNVSGAQFSDPNLLENISDALHDSGLPPHCLKLELTESVLMTMADDAVNILNAVRQLGVLVGIDDFGTGYSSLSYLHRFPVNTLKVDRSFVTGIGADNENGKIVRTIIALAHELGMDVVAEGVEDVGELDHLRDLNCEFAQGYFFSRPVPPRDILKLLRESS